MGLRFFTNEPLSQRFLLSSTPLSARIAARVDLEGSRGLESLPGALFFSRSDVTFFEKVLFLPEKNRRRPPREPQTRAGGRRQAGGGRRQAGKGRRQAGAAPEAGRPPGGQNPENPKNAPRASGGLRGPLGAPPVPSGALKGPHGAPWGPMGPHGPPLRCGTCAKRSLPLFSILFKSIQLYTRGVYRR